MPHDVRRTKKRTDSRDVQSHPESLEQIFEARTQNRRGAGDGFGPGPSCDGAVATCLGLWEVGVKFTDQVEEHCRGLWTEDLVETVEVIPVMLSL